MVNIISFSLWGQNSKYCVGAIRNAELAPQIYPGWRCIFQLDAHVPLYVWNTLGEMEHVDVVRRIDPQTHGLVKGDWRGMFWRFEYANNPLVEVMISRDCDSRLNMREASAVQEWLSSGKGFHIMHDHPYHTVPMLGGMWGCRSGALPEFDVLMAGWNQEDRWQTDQEFLNQVIYPRIKHDCMNHDSFFTQWGGRPFPSPRRGDEFVGQVFDENDNTVEEHIVALRNAIYF